VLSQRLDIKIITDFNPQNNELYIVYGAHDKAIELLTHQKNLKNTFGYIILQSEQPSSIHIKNKYYIELMQNNIVFDFHSISSEYLEKNYKIITRAYHWFDFLDFQQEEVERDIDILFVGAHSKLREEIFIQLQFQLGPDKKIEFVFDNSLTQPLELTKKLKRTKVVLNIPFYEDKILETHRINKALSCGCKVLSKKSGDETTDNLYNNYIHFVDDYSEVPIGDKKPYSELQKLLTNSITENIKWYVEQLKKSKSNKE